MNISQIIKKKEKSISLCLEYEEAKEYENLRVKYEVVPLYQDWKLNFFIFDKNHNELYFGSVNSVLNWFKRRNVEPFASEVFVRKEYEKTWYSKTVFEQYKSN